MTYDYINLKLNLLKCNLLRVHNRNMKYTGLITRDHWLLLKINSCYLILIVIINFPKAWLLIHRNKITRVDIKRNSLFTRHETYIIELLIYIYSTFCRLLKYIYPYWHAYFIQF